MKYIDYHFKNIRSVFYLFSIDFQTYVCYNIFITNSYFTLQRSIHMKKIGSFFFYIYTVFTCTCISVPCHVFCYGSHSVLRTYPLYFFFQPYLRRSLEQNIRFMVHDTCKYPDHDCIFPSLYRSIWLLVSCRV